ncbi:hypothetical protein EDWATA_03739 [Edwardsiella tarda ATCC 23685]|uniref:Uncharacterized protein n=1 Tax=Edwardsiella tarda ATCC 23685 TaxID=500638 RepID=D4FAC1_EDWTA|nr:hypothetical protein EDWATA_03739 [Edwardsiella tarda ATCC 23685]
MTAWDARFRKGEDDNTILMPAISLSATGWRRPPVARTSFSLYAASVHRRCSDHL